MEIKQFKEEFIMLEIMVFAVVLGLTLIVSSCIASFIMMRIFMNKKVLKKYTKVCYDVAQESVNEMFQEDELY